MARVMVIDDSLPSRHMMKALAEAAGHEVVAICDNGWDGLQKIKALAPDLVFLDMLMPQMDGIDVLRHLKGAPGRPKVIMLSSVTAREKIVAAREAGADAYLLKPFSIDKVTETIARCLAQTAS